MFMKGFNPVSTRVVVYSKKLPIPGGHTVAFLSYHVYRNTEKELFSEMYGF
jgi:hypothetical protein